MEEWVVNTFIRGLALGTPLLWAALGEIYAERSGVVNLGVEGMMILGAFSAFALAQTTANPLLGLLIAAGAGAAAALLHAFVTITLRANQYVSGLALTMLGLGLSALLGRRWEGLPLLDTLPEVSAFTYLSLLLAVLLWFVLYHTRGWIAIAIAIFASWDPLRAVAGAFLFGALFHLSFRLQTWVAPEPLQMMPFAFTIVVLALTARRGGRAQGAPAALGLPYVRGER